MQRYAWEQVLGWQKSKAQINKVWEGRGSQKEERAQVKGWSDCT